MDKSESNPFKAAFIGTPITGRIVFEAITPGKCAASPAPAIMHWKSSFSSFSIVFSNSSGTLWAERIKSLVLYVEFF